VTVLFTVTYGDRDVRFLKDRSLEVTAFGPPGTWEDGGSWRIEHGRLWVFLDWYYASYWDHAPDCMQAAYDSWLASEVLRTPTVSERVWSLPKRFVKWGPRVWNLLARGQ